MMRSLLLSVSVRVGCYRHIQIDESATLFQLHQTILDTFDFNDDHLHAFFMNNRAWDDGANYVCPESDLDDARGFSNEVELAAFHLKKDDKFLYIFDFGDEWRFQIKVLRVIDAPTPAPTVLKSTGQISQYGDSAYDF
jgi:hypothetical protein